MLLGQSMTLFGAVLIAGGFWYLHPTAGAVCAGLFFLLGGAVVYRQSSSPKG